MLASLYAGSEETIKHIKPTHHLVGLPIILMHDTIMNE